MSFVHLHTHSHYSLLDGLSKVDGLVQRAKAYGMPALALTDHGVLYGAVEFYRTAVREGIKPIIGVEAYLSPRSRTQRDPGIDDDASHLTILARNEEGYRNLLRIVTIAHLEGFYYRPRIDFETLAQHAKGLIVLSGCINGEIPRLILKGDVDGASRRALQYKDMVGSDFFYFELQHHPELEGQDTVNRALREMGQRMRIPVVATQDSHYLDEEDREAQDIMVCIQSGKTVNDTGRLDMRENDLSFWKGERMREAFADIPEACDNTLRIADQVNMSLSLGKWIFPHYPLPTGITASDQLERQARQGLAARYPDGIPDDAKERLNYELSVINKRGYATYFLVVADFVTWSRTQNIIATTRGSAAGSLVAYGLGITNINPLEYKLPFERFLNLARPIPPDIDMDFSDNRRDEVIAYVTNRYGKDNVAQIITFGTMQARASVRDVARVLGFPYSFGDRLAKMIPQGGQGFPTHIKDAILVNDEMRAAAKEPDAARVFTLAERLEGTARHASVHAAGVVISSKPLAELTPLQYESKGKKIITQYDMGSLEALGLVKMDFLGIRNLSILGRAVEIVAQTKGISIDLDNLPLDDRMTFHILSEGETIGLFQLGGSGMTRYLKELKPTTIFDIMAMVALFRPGPMNSIPEFIRRKHNPKLIRHLDPRLKDILSMSYGVITYQDDVLLIAIHIAGYTWEEADKLRKAMGKKIPVEMSKQQEKFISGCVSHGLRIEKAHELWKLIEPFAAYGFNKAHAASYAMVAYQTAYMKAHHPAEFMASVMTAESGDLEKVAEAINECRKMGIVVLPPDIQESYENFTVVDDSHIRFGLRAVKNVGEDIVGAIIRERKEHGTFKSLADFALRVQTKNLNKKTLESLAKCGALESLGERAQILEHTDTILNLSRNGNSSKHAQGSLFGAEAEKPSLALRPVTPASKRQLLIWEKELLGLYITEHPFGLFQERVRNIVIPLKDVASHFTSVAPIRVAGIITQLQKKFTRSGEQMIFVKIEDTTGSLEVLVFPSLLRAHENEWEENKAVVVSGKLSTKDGQIKLLGNDVREIPPPEYETQ